MRKKDPLVLELVQLHERKYHNEILEKIKEINESGDKEGISVLRLLSWPSPLKTDLISFKEFIESNKVTNIYSIGCGTGLLEWLMLRVILEEEKLTGIKLNSGGGGEKEEPYCFGEMTGVEIDFGWWSSQYSPPMFLPLRFIDKDFTVKEGFGCENDLSLFCYFNNLPVFLDYLENFKGKFVGILGPISKFQFCAPAPLELVENPKMPTENWELIQFKPFGMGDVDHLAIYKKVIKTCSVSSSK